MSQKQKTTPATEAPLHTQGDLWRDDDGFIAIGSGDNYHTFADLDCSDLDISEREANKERLIMCWNNYQSLVNERQALLDENTTLKEARNVLCQLLRISAIAIRNFLPH